MHIIKTIVEIFLAEVWPASSKNKISNIKIAFSNVGSYSIFYINTSTIWYTEDNLESIWNLNNLYRCIFSQALAYISINNVNIVLSP